MVDVTAALNERQAMVLRWVADGCPPDRMADTSYKRTAMALQDRRLVRVSRGRNGWQAVLTDAGSYYLDHGHHPDRNTTPPAPARRTSQRPRAPRAAAAGPTRPNVIEASTDQPARGPIPPEPPRPDRISPDQSPSAPLEITAELLLARLREAGGALTMSGLAEDELAAWRRAGKVAQLRLRRAGRQRLNWWPGLGTLRFALDLVRAEDADDDELSPAEFEAMWLATQPPPVLPRTAEFLGRRVPVPTKEKSDHPQVARLVTVIEIADRLADSRYGLYSLPLIRRRPLGRMRRIWQAIINEAALRGYETRVDEEGHGAGLTATLVVVIGKDQCRVDLYGDTTTPLRLSIPGDDVSSRPRAEEWTNARGGPIEQRLGEVFTRIEQRAERAIEQRAEKLRRDEERHQQWKAAMAKALAAYAEDHRRATIVQRIADVAYAEDIRSYCEALRVRAADLPDPRRGDVLAWAQWAAQYADSIDVRRTGGGMPATPDPKPEELKPYLGWLWSPYGSR